MKTKLIQLKIIGKIIKTSIKETANLLNRLGYSEATITSTNAIIPLVYFFYNGGKWRNRQRMLPDFEDIRKYLSIIRIKQIFSGQTHDKLKFILSVLDKNNTHPFNELLKNEMFKVSQKDIEDALLTVKGKDTFPILSLLYDKKYDECNFSQDHMYPMVAFGRKSTYRDSNIPEDKMNEWSRMADTLPNLQILSTSENSSKNDTPLKVWVDEQYPTTEKRNVYFKENYIPVDTSLEFADFESFYKARKKMLLDVLMKKFGLKK